MLCIYNHGLSISYLWNILEKLGFTTSKTVLGIWYKENCTQAASRVAKRLKTYDLKNLGHNTRKKKENVKIGWRWMLVPSLSSRNKTCAKVMLRSCQRFAPLSNFAYFFLLPNIMSRKMQVSGACKK